MRSDVLAVVTCTSKKSAAPTSSLTLRTVRGASLPVRAATWLERLQGASGAPVKASDLYAGNHWQVVRSLSATKSPTARLLGVWVLSAGYGLIPLDAMVHSYAATFAPNHPDSVTAAVMQGGANEVRRAWYEHLARWRGPHPDSPRTLAELVGEHKNSIMLVAGSDYYLDAVASDLLEAAQTLRPGRLAVFSAGTENHRTLDPYRVPCNATLQAELGGPLNSLNVRCLRYAIGHAKAGGLELPALNNTFSRLLKAQPERTKYNRRPLSDDDVCTYIRKALAKDPTAHFSPLHRMLRDSGRACGQERFARLFERMKRGAHRD